MIKIRIALTLVFTMLTSSLVAQNDTCKRTNLLGLLANMKLEFIGKSMVLTVESKQRLLKTAETLKDLPDYKIRIIGYSPRKGDSIDNKLLSKNRANQVMNILLYQGVKQASLCALGKGEMPKRKRKNRKKRTPINYIEFEVLDLFPNKLQ